MRCRRGRDDPLLLEIDGGITNIQMGVDNGGKTVKSRRIDGTG